MTFQWFFQWKFQWYFQQLFSHLCRNTFHNKIIAQTNGHYGGPTETSTKLGGVSQLFRMEDSRENLFFPFMGVPKTFFDPLNLIWPQKPPLWGGPIFAQKWLFLTFLFWLLNWWITNFWKYAPSLKKVGVSKVLGVKKVSRDPKSEKKIDFLKNLPT